MARAILSASISFGMLSIPVKVYAATESKDISFNLTHTGCGSRIKQLRVCPQHDNQVLEGSDIERGYAYAKDALVSITDADLANLPLPSKHLVDLSSFVPAREVDRIFCEKTYFLEPGDNGAKPYRLLYEAMQAKELMGIGKVTLRSKERICAIRAVHNVLVLETMFWPDEIRELTSGMIQPPVSISDQERGMAMLLLDAYSGPFQPAQYTDGYREALQAVIEAKLSGTAPVQPVEAPVVPASQDVMAMLKASLAQVAAERAA